VDVTILPICSGITSLHYLETFHSVQYYYHKIWISLVTGLFFLVLLLNQRWSPPLRLQVSHCSTFRVMCAVPSIAVFCSESIECFPGTASKFFLQLFVTIPVAPIITGIIVHFRFHNRYISIHKLLYFKLLLLLLLLLLYTAIEFSLGGSGPYTSNKHNTFQNPHIHTPTLTFP